MSDLFGNHIVGFPTRRLNYCEMRTPTFAIMEHAGDVSDVDAKTLILWHKMCFLRLLIFYILTAQSMLKNCPLLEHGLITNL